MKITVPQPPPGCPRKSRPEWRKGYRTGMREYLTDASEVSWFAEGIRAAERDRTNNNMTVSRVQRVQR